MHPALPQTMDDQAMNYTVWWWLPETCHLQVGSLHCWLSRASAPCMHHIWVVSKVSHPFIIFKETGVHDDFSLLCQHSLSHYCFLIQQFRAPNGLCSSIKESTHIKVIKNPYHHSSCNEPLGQMLLTNQCLDKLATTWVNFATCGLLQGPLLSSGIANEPHADVALNVAHDNEDGAEGGITSMGDVKLAQNPGK